MKIGAALIRPDSIHLNIGVFALILSSVILNIEIQNKHACF